MRAVVKGVVRGEMRVVMKSVVKGVVRGEMRVVMKSVVKGVVKGVVKVVVRGVEVTEVSYQSKTEIKILVHSFMFHVSI